MSKENTPCISFSNDGLVMHVDVTKARKRDIVLKTFLSTLGGSNSEFTISYYFSRNNRGSFDPADLMSDDPEIDPLKVAEKVVEMKAVDHMKVRKVKSNGQVAAPTVEFYGVIPPSLQDVPQTRDGEH